MTDCLCIMKYCTIRSLSSQTWVKMRYWVYQFIERYALCKCFEVGCAFFDCCLTLACALDVVICAYHGGRSRRSCRVVSSSTGWSVGRLQDAVALSVAVVCPWRASCVIRIRPFGTCRLSTAVYIHRSFLHIVDTIRNVLLCTCFSQSLRIRN